MNVPQLTRLHRNNNRKEEKGMSMIVSTKGRYALRVMIDLSLIHI